MCEKTFCSSIYNKHVREVHNIEPDSIPLEINKAWSYRCLQLDCNQMFPTNMELLEHLEIHYNIPYETNCYTMKTWDGKYFLNLFIKSITLKCVFLLRVFKMEIGN